MPNNLVSVTFHLRKRSWVKTPDSRQSGSSAPAYSQVEEEQIRESLDLLNDHLGVRRILESLPTRDLHADLRRLVELQCAIVHVLQVVEGTASAVLQIFIDRGAEEEELEERMRGMVDDIVDAGHGVDDGEDFDFDQNNVDS